MAEEWQSFEEGLIPAEANEHQRHDMKVSFYCGATSFCNLLMKLAAGVDTLSAKELRQELDAFFVDAAGEIENAKISKEQNDSTTTGG